MKASDEFLVNMKLDLKLSTVLLLFHVVLIASNSQIVFQEGYSVDERPPTTNNQPVLINASINLRNILDVAEKEQIISLETTLRLYWKDKRIKPLEKYIDSEDLIGRYVTLNPDKTKQFWMPDVFIDQAKALRVPTYYTKPASLRVYSDSTIRYSSRINYDVACNMDFHRFPVDEQYCEVKFESFGYSSKQIQMQWMDWSQSNVNANISLAQFSFNVLLMDSYNTDYYDIAYPGLIMKLHFTRQLGYHLVQTYIPSAVFVVLAWLSLFIPVESVPGRVGMGMTTLLTLTAMFSSVRQNVPKISYISLLDIWMLLCMLFVFSCIGEFIIATIFLRRGRKQDGDKFELLFKIGLPVVFVLFNIIYWSIVLTGYYDEK